MLSCCVLHVCILFGVGRQRRFECIYFLCTRVHAPVTKKKLHLFKEDRRRNKEVVTRTLMSHLEAPKGQCSQSVCKE
jgi:hypothetical protein